MSTSSNPDNGQKTADAFNKAFWDWKNSTPENFEYVRKTGHSITGLHNMLFHFFEAGCKHAAKS